MKIVLLCLIFLTSKIHFIWSFLVQVMLILSYIVQMIIFLDSRILLPDSSPNSNVFQPILDQVPFMKIVLLCLRFCLQLVSPQLSLPSLSYKQIKLLDSSYLDSVSLHNTIVHQVNWYLLNIFQQSHIPIAIIYA